MELSKSPKEKRSRRETHDQRQRRLARQQEYNGRRRTALSSPNEEGTEEERGAPRETEEQYERRLLHQREYAKRRRSETATASTAGESDKRQQLITRKRDAAKLKRLTKRSAIAAVPSDVVAESQLQVASSTPIETEQNYHTRLANQRAYDRRRRLQSISTGLQRGSVNPSVTTPVMQDMPLQEFDPSFQPRSLVDDTNSLAPASSDVVDRVEAGLQDALGADGLDECVCAVCDRLVLRSASRQVDMSDKRLLVAMQKVLQPPSNLPELLKQQYCCGSMDGNLEGLMLSHRGLKTYEGQVNMKVCDDCHLQLVKGGDKPPKYAIANGFYIGLLPDHLFAATWIEKVMTQLVTVVAQTRVMRGGRHRAIRSHCMVFDATPGPPATLLPRRIDRGGSYRVVLAGPMTATQSDRIRKLHHARGSVVRDLLAFFKTNNLLYHDVNVDDSSIDAIDLDESLCEQLFIHIEDSEAADAVDAEQESVASRPDNTNAAEGGEENDVIERNVLLADEGTATNSTFVQQRVVDLNRHEPSSIPRVRVDHSSRFASTVDVEAKMYPHLFPFGRGHPNEARATPVSKRDCMRYYAMLSSRRFAQDPTFLLTAFSRLSLENMYTLTAVKCRRYGSLFEGYEGISTDELMEALVNNERRHRGERRQTLTNPTAERFLKSVELGSVSVWGSSAERRQCRQEAFGYQTRFGQPALFVTLTPNTDNSYAMAHYTGILSVDTLFDSLEARTPTPIDMKKAAMMDDCASARLFMRTIDAFIKHILGCDPKTQESTQEGGLFGRTKAYYGMVETQGRGTLHIHFLIWLFGGPVNSESFEQCVARQGSTFMEGLEAYADSIVTTELPLPVDRVQCKKCHTQGQFVALPIPSRARRTSSKRKLKEQLEPLLVKCDACGEESSSQHLVRQVLLGHRPPHWPPPLASLSNQDMVASAVREAGARSSLEEALAVVQRREMFHTVVVADEADEITEWLLHSSDSRQQSYVHADEDPAKLDPVYRFIEMTPPTLNRARMSPEHYAFMIASLVANLNMHAWTHTTSCFKASRATLSACDCRYGFPRARTESSSLSGPSVRMKRTLGHEYINGYNPTIMAMFKCNHDVQVLFGGKDAITRIYYCCKYVTKPQRQIDSATAVALANFQRRQAKEAIDRASDTPPTVQDVRRRRVTGMIHTFTNKQEIAGPLAALYLLRGSCCYASASCVKLPLSDILKQLESNGDYMCTLVQSQHAVYTSASSLDDYMFRPLTTSNANVYEFFMRCYRRQLAISTAQSHRFGERHPLSNSHCIAFRRKEAVPVIKGPRLVRRKEAMTRDELEEYARLALVLFKPFRSLNDLIGPFEHEAKPWYPAYCEWEGDRSDFTKMIMDNMNDYYAGREAENEASLQGEVGDDEELDRSDADQDSSDDAYFSDDYLEVDDSVDTRDTVDMIDDASDLANDESVRTFPSPTMFPRRIQEVLRAITDHDLVGHIASASVTHEGERFATPLTVEALRKWVENTSSDSAENPVLNMSDTAVSEMQERSTTVTEMIDNALLPEQRRWDPTGTVPLEAPMYSGISVISRLFTLNKLQHGAFALVATHLLRRWRPSPPEASIISDEEVDRRQLRLYLGGEGGTGKSRVIQAIQELCRCWQRPGSTVVCAMTGKAATLINGRTLASFLVFLKGANSHIELQDIDCIIVDEVSMMAKDDLLKLSRALNKAKRLSHKNAKFGGIHTILVGDIFQLPPVLADPLFIDPASKTSKVSVVDFDGFELWRTFDKIVILRDSVRFKDDPEWGEGCSKARYGEWTPAFVEMINSRLVSTPPGCEVFEDGLSQLPPPGTVFVSPDNDTRAAINGQFIARAASLLPSDLLPVRCVANFKGALNKLSSEDVSFIMGLPDNKFGRMAPYLDLIPGMPIQVTQNIRTQKGVANGTVGFLEHVEFPSGTTFRRALDKRTGAVVHIPDRRPLFALLRLDRGKNKKPLAEDVDASLFPVFPDAEPFKKSEIKLTPRSGGERRILSIKIQQFPFVCSVGATVYKVQGESLKSMAVVDWKVDARGVNKPQQVYLMVSRVVKRDGLICLSPLTPNITDWARPSKATLDEDRRLAEGSDSTLTSFYAEQQGSLM